MSAFFGWFNFCRFLQPNTMAEISEIKGWIRETRTIRPTSDDAILIFPGTDSTRITLLDTACCIPAIVIRKRIEDIENEDIASLAQIINHHH